MLDKVKYLSIISNFQISASDADTDVFGPVRYEIIEGDPLGNFTLDPVTGILKTATELDHEKQQTFVVVVEAKDGKYKNVYLNRNFINKFERKRK